MKKYVSCAAAFLPVLVLVYFLLRPSGIAPYVDIRALRLPLTSFGFAVFFALSLLAYYAVPRRLQWCVLLSCSLIFFFLSAKPATFLYLLAAAGTAYAGARLASRPNARHGKAVTALCVLAVLGILAALKYVNFLVINWNYAARLLHRGRHLPRFSPLAPIGISFYTLTLVGYLLDCRSGKAQAERSFPRFLLFACYWPQLTSGPITRHAQIAPRLYEGHEFSYTAVSQGIVRITWGFFQKLVIVGHVALIQRAYLGEPGKYQGFYVWLGMAAGALQLYADFNGCMDIVLGASECFGIALPENFNVPFASTSVAEFWRRWHITLGRWLYDYVFFPVYGSRPVIAFKNALVRGGRRRLANKLAMHLGTGAVWFCMGLWHGGTWKYILGNGLWYWLLITLAQELAPLGRRLDAALGIRTETFSWRLFRRIRTFAFFCIGTTFFYAASFSSALTLLRHSLARFNPLVLLSVSLEDFGMNYLHRAIFVLGVSALVLVDVAKFRAGSARKVLSGQNAWFRWALYWGMVAMILLSSTLSTQEFLYAQF